MFIMCVHVLINILIYNKRVIDWHFLLQSKEITEWSNKCPLARFIHTLRHEVVRAGLIICLESGQSERSFLPTLVLD